MVVSALSYGVDAVGLRHQGYNTLRYTAFTNTNRHVTGRLRHVCLMAYYIVAAYAVETLSPYWLSR